MADEHNAEWYENTFKRMIYWVGGVLIAGTAITYVIDKWGVAEKYGLLTAVIFGLTVATIKAATVIVIFMRLKWDWKFKTISLTLISTVLFFIGMMWLTVGSEVKTYESNDGKPGNKDNTWKHGEHAVGINKPGDVEKPKE